MKIASKKKFNIIFNVLIILIVIVFVSANEANTEETNSILNNSNLYAFQGINPDNIVLVATTQSMMSDKTEAIFNPNSLIEFNIDNNDDNMEDLVIQAIQKDDKIYFFGLAPPNGAGVTSRVLEGSPIGSVKVSKGIGAPNIATTNAGISLFAGLRDNPFFFDLKQFNNILLGNASEFNNPGTDTFANTNVMSIVIELPKDLITPPADGKINVWLEIKTQQ